MNLFPLLFSSLFFLFVCYYSAVCIHADIRKSYIGLLIYRLSFFAIQSFLFYAVYNNQLDVFFYQNSLIELTTDFNQHPFDLIAFFQSDYTEMHITNALQSYLQEEVRAAFFLKVLIPFSILSVNNYYLSGCWFTLFGTICYMPFLAMYKKGSSFNIWLLVLLIPSFTLWTVGVLKEAFVLPVLFLLWYYLNKIMDSKSKDIFSICLFLLFCWLAWNVKYYLVSVFLLATMIYFINSKISYSFNTVLFSILVIATSIIFMGYMHPALHWNVLPTVIYDSYTITCTKYTDAYNCIPFDMDPTWASIVLNYPKAILYAFFSPFPWQIHNVTSLLAAFETYMFVALFAIVFYRWAIKKIYISNVELLGLFIILLLGGLLIMASPNIGSFNRYRIFYLPVSAFILVKHSGLIQSKVLLHFKKWIE